MVVHPDDVIGVTIVKSADIHVRTATIAVDHRFPRYQPVRCVETNLLRCRIYDALGFWIERDRIVGSEMVEKGFRISAVHHHRNARRKTGGLGFLE